MYDPTRHRRRSIRLRGYDYTTPGAYFVTICVHGRVRLFGEVLGGAMRLNSSGAMIRVQLEALSRRFPAVGLDAYAIMPDHLHCVLAIVASAGPDIRLGDAVGTFKSLTTNAYIAGVQQQGWPPFERRLWQRNYYEQIIRDDADLAQVREYIQLNPARWEFDPLHPTAGLKC